MNPDPGATRAHPPRILIVDDDNFNRKLLKVMLADEGFVLPTAATGEEALSMVADEPPDLILLDVMMPGMDGCEVAATLKAHASKGRTLFLSIHQISDAARICDRFVLLSGGRVAGEGTLGELRAKAGLPGADLEEAFLALT